jgi:hypothetical protein
VAASRLEAGGHLGCPPQVAEPGASRTAPNGDQPYGTDGERVKPGPPPARICSLLEGRRIGDAGEAAGGVGVTAHRAGQGVGDGQRVLDVGERAEKDPELAV